MSTRRDRLLYMDSIAIMLLLGICVIFFRKILLSNRIIVGIDTFTYFYPYRDYAAEAICSGRIPLWNPFLFLGAPFLANPQAAVFYPLNLALYWLSAPKLLAWSAAIHFGLGATFAYLYARRILQLSLLPAFLSSISFAFGGFLSGQVEHINQLNVSVWFPLLLLFWEQRNKWRWKTPIALGLVISMGLLAGHPQMSYISIAGLLLYALPPLLLQTQKAIRAARCSGEPLWKCSTHPFQGFSNLVSQVSNAFTVLATSLMIAVTVSAIQLLPTLELAQLSIRRGGLSYRESVAFSLKPLPQLLRYSFLPPFGKDLNTVFGGSYYTEYIAHIGVLPLALVLMWSMGAIILWFSRSFLARNMWIGHRSISLLILSMIGVFLALGLYNPFYFVLYKIIPGFNLFRVPARWLFFYAFGMAMLAGVALEQISRWIQQTLNRLFPISQGWLRTTFQLISLLIALAEFFYASSTLPFNHPTAPQAFSSLRTTPMYIKSSQKQTPVPGRVLSISDILFDPGDLTGIRGIFQDQLSPQALYDYIISSKYKEIVAPNLPLAWNVYTADGYDGGLLPLASYTALQHLFLDPADILTDGRLREGLSSIPPSRLLAILNVAFVITDKVQDKWIDNVFYDLSFDTKLDVDSKATISKETIPSFTATGLGIVSYIEGADRVAEGTLVAEVFVSTRENGSFSRLLYAENNTTEGKYNSDTIHEQENIGGQGEGKLTSNDYISVLRWESPLEITSISIRAKPFDGSIHIRGLALIDERDNSSTPLILSNQGEFQQVHSGDTKIYQVLDTLPRAFIVHKTQIYSNDQEAIALIADPEFDTSTVAVLSKGQALDNEPTIPSEVTITAYDPEFIAIRTSLSTPGYLILSDSWYPGWKASVDDRPTDIVRANIHFRAVYLSAGRHTVTFKYQPSSYTIGAGITLLSLVSLAVFAIFYATRRT